jgi:hypothetical protein
LKNALYVGDLVAQRQHVSALGSMKRKRTPKEEHVILKDALDFYRMLGLEIPESADEENHVEVEQGGLHLAFNTTESVQAILGGWEWIYRTSGAERYTLGRALCDHQGS